MRYIKYMDNVQGHMDMVFSCPGTAASSGNQDSLTADSKSCMEPDEKVALDF